MKLEEAERRLARSRRRASGFMTFAIENVGSAEGDTMLQRALAELQAISDNDELIDALYDADMRESDR